MRIASLDIETGSTKTNSIIFEVGIILVEVESYKDINLESLSNLLKRQNLVEETVLYLPFPYIEQCSLGRNQTVETITFHTSTKEKRRHFDFMMRRSLETNLSVEVVLDKIKEFCSTVDEIWINGLSFDPTILKSLGEAVGYKKSLWEFRVERDLRTIYRTFDINADVSKIVSHQALSDCVRNLATVKELGVQFDQGTLKLRAGILDPTKATATEKTV